MSPHICFVLRLNSLSAFCSLLVSGSLTLWNVLWFTLGNSKKEFQNTYHYWSPENAKKKVLMIASKASAKCKKPVAKVGFFLRLIIVSLFQTRRIVCKNSILKKKKNSFLYKKDLIPNPLKINIIISVGSTWRDIFLMWWSII